VYYRQKNKLISQKLHITSYKPVTTETVINAKNSIASDFGFSSRFGYDAGNRINAFAIKKSVDQSKFLILYTDGKKRTTDNGDVKSVININVYNADMTLDWKRSMTMPYHYKKMNADDFMVDAKGNFYTLASVFEKERVNLGNR